MQITSDSRTQVSASAGATSISWPVFILLQNSFKSDRPDPQTRNRRNCRTRGRTAKCAAACLPLPNTLSVCASLCARRSVATAEGMLIGTLMLATAYIALRKIYHGTPAVEGLGYTIFPGMLVFYAQMAYLRKRTAGTQALLIGGMLGFLYLVMWGACAIAAGIEPASRHLR